MRGGYERRPDMVLYLNGIAIAVIELKRSSVEVADGVRQLITNQEEIFNKGFFQHGAARLRGQRLAGAALRHHRHAGEFFVEWKDERRGTATVRRGVAGPATGADVREVPPARPDPQFHHLRRGQKKVPRPHQFVGVKAAQERIGKREGGVIWHTQGSGKSILMVLLAKWLLEHDPGGPHPCHHRPRRTGQADRGRDEERRGHRREIPLRPASPRGRSLSRNWGRPRPGCCARSSTSSIRPT